MSKVLGRFSPATRAWFEGTFRAATAAQSGAWDAISAGANALVVAPTGSGKTLAAFLWALDVLSLAAPAAQPGTRVLYVSPLKALAVDVERNLRAPLAGIARTAQRLGLTPPAVSVGVRTGDTPAAERQRLVRTPPDILITTPESLFLMLTSAARLTLAQVHTVIVDEVHSLAATKRGAHLALSLERLDLLAGRPAQRVGLSATVRPHEEVARFLAGGRPVTVVAPPADKQFDLRVVVPVEDMANIPAAQAPVDATAVGPVAAPASIWPHVEEQLVDHILAHRSAIVFANSRRLAERLTSRLNEVHADRTGLGLPASPPPPRPPAQVMAQAGVHADRGHVLARAHHGSVSKEQRAAIEEDLKAGRLRCVVATSSLELGIDMGLVDLVIQVQAPPSVASGLQRVGRAGHQVGEVSRGVLFPKHRADLLHCAVTVERMRAGAIEALAVPSNPLDVLAQQTVAAAALEPLDVEAWFAAVRRAGPFAALPRSAFEAVLDLLAGKYPSDRFAELRPRLVWDRDAGTVTGRPGAQRLAVTSGGTIPDRGMFTVSMVGQKAARVGELDEEMVYESRVGDVFALGSSSWRIEEITHDRVLVSPAPGQFGRLPFWLGDNVGRPAELGAAVGAFVRELAEADPAAARARLAGDGLDAYAVGNTLGYVADQMAATGLVPTDRTLLVERFRDELGDWRLVLHSPYGLAVHAPWALAVNARARQRYGVEGAAVCGDDAIILRLPDTDADPPGAELFAFDADEVEALVTQEVGGSAMFAARFRECAARALLLPRRDPGKRAPLWLQRQRSAQLLEVARGYPDFPIVLEAVRECLRDVYDVPGLVALLGRLERREVALAQVETPVPSPFAVSAMFGYTGSFMYEGDSPLAERKAAALSLDTTLLAELLGRVELRELLDADVVAEVEAHLQHLTPGRRARDAEGLADLLRTIGPLTAAEVAERAAGEPSGWLRELESSRRAISYTHLGLSWWAVTEDAARVRDALGVPPPPGVPRVFLDPVPDPLGDLVARYARCRGPFTQQEVAERFGFAPAVAADQLRRLAADRRVVEGEFRPAAAPEAAQREAAQWEAPQWGAGQRGATRWGATEWCDTAVLGRLRRQSLAKLRAQIEPVAATTLGRFLPAWHHVGAHGSPGRLRGVDGVLAVVEQLSGVPVPASAWEPLVLRARVADYTPAMLDELTAAGEVLWSGSGVIGGNDGWVALHAADTAMLTLAAADATAAPAAVSPLGRAVLGALSGGGAFFFRQIADALHPLGADDAAVAAALWELVWAGLLTNDTFTPVRALLSGAGTAAHRARPPAARPRRHRPLAASRVALPAHLAAGGRAGPPSAAGRWSLLPTAEADTTVRAQAAAELLLERYGVVTKGVVAAEKVPGGFPLVYKTLATFEERGLCRRGYYVDGLGAAQFATSTVVDRLRAAQPDPDAPIRAPSAVALAATDPANPYGAALPWPDPPADAATAHRPGRKPGALVVLVDGALRLYLERGGRSALVFTGDCPAAELRLCAEALAGLVHSGAVDSLTVESVNGAPALSAGLDGGSGAWLPGALGEAGFVATPRGWRLRR